jgi:hypothetical protein
VTVAGFPVFVDPDFPRGAVAAGYRGRSEPGELLVFLATRWRCAFYPWGYPRNPDGRPDSALCDDCGRGFRWRWEPGLAAVVYESYEVLPGESCFMCGEGLR